MKNHLNVSFILLISTFVHSFASHHERQRPIFKRQSASSDTSGSSSSSASFEEQYISHSRYHDQCVDHTDCSTKWSQRYWESNQYYKPGGPLFMFLGGETDVSGFANSGAWLHYAWNHNAFVMTVEHRFYGESFPTPQTDRSSQAMQLLTSQQALKDYARILKWVKEKNNLQKAKVVVFGGSYPGALAAWFRDQYPDLVNVAVASSAPLKYSFEFQDWVRTASKVIRETNRDCYDRLKSTFTCMQKVVNGTTCSQTDATDKNDLPRKINMCLDFNTEVDTEQFFIKSGREIWTSITPGTTSAKLCPILLENNGRDIVKEYGKFITKSKSNTYCSNRRKRQSRTDVKDADAKNDPGGYTYSWYWQSCNEFVNLQVADQKYKMLGTVFGKNAEVTGCQYYYPDAGFTETTIRANVEKTQAQYKSGKDYKGTCVIFVNGSWDPWATRSITSKKDTSDKNTVYYYDKGEHCDDMLYPPSNQFVPQDIMKIQNKINKQIGVYLQSSDC